MLMDLTCPIDFRRAELLRDSTGRGQAYFTFHNDADTPITFLEGHVTLINAQGIEIRRLGMHAQVQNASPHADFVVSQIIDDLPDFTDAHVVVETLHFQNAGTWCADEHTMIDCTPPALPQGPARVALVAVAGHDAVCYPQHRSNAWVCVCGCFNRKEASACRRCLREAEKTFADLTPEHVQAAYEQYCAQILQADQQSRALERKRFAAVQHRQRSKRKAQIRLRKAGIVLALCMLLALMVYHWWFASHAGIPASAPAPTAEVVDYLPLMD